MQSRFREFIFILFYRLWLIIGVFLAVFLTSIVIAVTLPSIYRSTAKFSLSIPQNLDPLQQENFFDYRNRMRRSLQDQKELMTSNRVLSQVVQELYPGSNQESVISKKVDDLRENMNVDPPGGETFDGSNVFILEFTDRNPTWAAKVASSIVENYLKAYRILIQAKSDFSHSFFQEQTKILYKEMQDKEAPLREFETKQALALLEILNLDTNKPTNTEVGPNMLLTQFLRSYHELQTELAGLEVSISSLERENRRSGIPTVLPEMEVTGRSITVFKNKIAQLQLQLNEMRSQFKENFEPMQRVEQELTLSVDSLKKELTRSLTAQKITAQTIKARISQLEQTIHGLRERIQAIANEKATYQSLVQGYNLAKTAYTNAQGTLGQARMAQALQQDKQFVTLIDTPTVPLTPFKPNRTMLAVGGLISGILLGIAVAVTFDHFDHHLKTEYEIEQHLNIPVLGSIPSL